MKAKGELVPEACWLGAQSLHGEPQVKAEGEM